MSYFKFIDAKIIFKIMLEKFKTRMNFLVKRIVMNSVSVNFFRFHGFRISVLKISFMLCAQTIVKACLIDCSPQGSLKI